MEKPSFIHKKSDYLKRVSKSNTDIRLLAKERSLEVMKQKIANGSKFYLDSSEEWQGFEFIYLLEGKMEYGKDGSSYQMKPGDYIARKEIPERSWFETKTDVIVLYASNQPAFYLLRDEIEDYLQLAKQVESKEHMEGHSKRLVNMSRIVGKRLGLPLERLSDLNYAAFFHDIGKSEISDEILDKQSELNEEEWEIMKKHTIWGKELLEEQENLERVGEIVEQSHERPDGSGYPHGLRGDEICLEAKIVAVVDAWDAMRTDRPYRDALSEEEAIRELNDNAGTQFDEKVVEAFIEIYREREIEGGKIQKNDTYKEISNYHRQREELSRLSDEMLSASSMDEVLSKTVDAVANSTSFKKVVIYLFEDGHDPQNPDPVKVRKIKHSGLTEAEIESLQKGDGSRFVNPEEFDPKYQLGNSYYKPCEERLENFDEEITTRKFLRKEEIVDWHPEDSLYSPIYSDGEIIGKISVGDPEDGLIPSEEKLKSLETFANLAALGITNIYKS